MIIKEVGCCWSLFLSFRFCWLLLVTSFIDWSKCGIVGR